MGQSILADESQPPGSNRELCVIMLCDVTGALAVYTSTCLTAIDRQRYREGWRRKSGKWEKVTQCNVR